MKVMLLAAGRGERMRPLTDKTPKPLLEAGGKTLAARLIEQLARDGFRDLVINLAHLGAMIAARFGDGRDLGVNIRYSHERAALETAGGIALALPLLGDPFLAVNADLHTDFPFNRLRHVLRGDAIAHLVLVDNPSHHPAGDFALTGGQVANAGNSMLTFSGIGVYRAQLFAGIPPGTRGQLATLLREHATLGRVTGEHFRGRWYDVGTPERLAALDAELKGVC
jgi:MurNAc alpha-1-phosphate uridylyltransferase